MMKGYRLEGVAIVALLASWAAWLQLGALADDDKGQGAGWEQLFNGKDLTGWEVYPKGTGNWKVENGILIGSGRASHLFTKRDDYTDFDYKIEAKIKDGLPEDKAPSAADAEKKKPGNGG